MSGVVALEPTRRRLSGRQAATVDVLMAAAGAELAACGYEALTVRRVARRAGVAPATAYTYFASKAHLVAEVFWRRLRARPDPALDPARPMAERVAAALGDLADLVASEPRLAAACSPALLADDPDVAVLRDRIGGELHRRLRAAVGDEADADTLAGVLDLVLAGALLRAGMGHVAYDDLAGILAGAARVVIGDRP
jgi:TetR/AcrR family transcriptional regulator, cholesterol catabolism regulator